MSQEEATILLASVQKKNALMDNIAAIPPFSGESSSTSCLEFLEKLDNLANFFNWEEEETKFALLNRLSGAALKWVKPLKQKPLKEIIHAIKEKYCPKQTPEAALIHFTSYKQTANISVQEFFDKASELSAHTLVIEGVDPLIVENSRKAVLKSMLLNNLAPEIRKGVITKDPQTPEEILKFALLEEKALRSINPFYEQIPQPSLNPQQPQLACAALEMQKQVQIRDREVESLKEQIQLLNIKLDSLIDMRTENKNNNMNQFVPRNIFCYVCDQPDHIARNCPFKNQSYEQNNGFFFNNRGRGNMGNGNNYRGGYNNRGYGNYNNRGRGSRGNGNNNRIQQRGGNRRNNNRQGDEQYNEENLQQGNEQQVADNLNR